MRTCRSLLGRLSVHLLTVVLCVWSVAVMAAGDGFTIYVSPDGSDDWTGRSGRLAPPDGPVATLQKARELVRGQKPLMTEAGRIVIELLPGTYELTGPLELAVDDSGIGEQTVTYRAARGGEVRIVGGKLLTGFEPVSDPAVLERLPERARGNVVQVDLNANGVTDYGSPGGGGMELFYNDVPMTLSRWPNEGFVRIKEVLEVTPVDVRGTKGDKGGRFVYEEDRASRWLDEGDLWLHGYWFWDWSDQRMQVESIDTDQKIIQIREPEKHHYGYRKGQWYYAFNALSEIDMPGEWYADRDQGILYFWPPSPIEHGRAVVSVLENLITLDGASNIRIEALTLEACRGTAIIITGGTAVEVVGCTIRNTGTGVSVSGGTHSGVVGCDIHDTGGAGITLSAGDRRTLTPAGLYAENNHIHDWGRIRRMYAAAVHVYGVGNRVSHNLLYSAPHTAIFFGGNDHLIEFNEIHSVCYESNDAGAIYAGRDWSMRGTVIRSNYLHHISGREGRGCVGVYLDDMYCGTEIAGNLFYDVTRAAFIGGGRDNIVANNIFVDCKPAVHVDARAMGWAKSHTDGWVTEATEKGTHKGIEYQKPPYSTRWPELARVLEADPYAPEGNVIARNISVGGRWDGFQAQAMPFIHFENNMIDEDPHFVDRDGANFQLRDNSPAYELGFERIPLEKIGLYESTLRASWPVTHSVRPMPTPPPTAAAVTRSTFEVYEVWPRQNTIEIDGVLDAGEWPSREPGREMLLAQGINGEPVEPHSRAWLVHDADALYVGVYNRVSRDAPLSQTAVWGRDDAVELAFRNPDGGASAPIVILRGYPNGHFESSDEAGAPKDVVERAIRGVEYRASVPGPGRWTAEWAIPLASIGFDPSRHTRLQFNLSVRKSAEPVWVEWQGTAACTWEVRNAGVLEFVK